MNDFTGDPPPDLAARPPPAATAEGPPRDPDAFPLPPLRTDLRLIEGDADDGGAAPRWKIHDPLAQRFFELEQGAVDLLSLWHTGTVGALRERASARLGYSVAADTVLGLVGFLQRHELLRAIPGATFTRVRQAEASALAHRTWWRRLLHGYLFIKLPLARPDRFLRRTLPWVGFAFSPLFWMAMAVLAVFSLYLVSRQWERFLSTLPDMFSVTGVVAFALSLALVKTLHELGHGYTAVRLGSRVSTMGVAFVVMMPVLYTDTTDAWRLRTRGERVRIDAAGMAVELVVAVLATFTWVFLPDGGARHAAFALATTGWVLSLAVNLNPLMRFDGYYLFSDFVGVPNLQERSFAMARWWLREALFGYGDEMPEPMPLRRRRFFIGYAFATWIYRFFLFLGIALLVYHFFFKLLGIFLFAVELGWFIAMPIWRELRVWFERRRDGGARVRLSALVMLALLAAFVMPWPYRVRIPAVLTAAQQAPSFAAQPARIERILVRQGDAVKAQQVMLTLSAPQIEQELDKARERERLLHERIGRRVADARDLSESLVLARELRLEGDRIDGLERERARLVVRAPMDGVVMQLAPELHPGRWVDARTQLALVGQPGTLEARGYLDGDDLGRIHDGEDGRFVDEHFLAPPLPVRVKRIAAGASETLDNWMLASVHGGAVPARTDRNAARPEQAMFEVAAQAGPDASPPQLTELRGEIQLRGTPQSLASRMFQRVMRVLVREGSA